MINNTKQSGQILLVVVMLLAVGLTVVLSTAFNSITNTQTTKLEEDSQKALAAAEAGIEAALNKNQTQNISSLSGLSDFSGQAKLSLVNNERVFMTPLLEKDDQYTFYLANYPLNTSTSSYDGGLTIFYGSSSDCNAVTLEITLVYDNPPLGSYDTRRFIADTGNKLGGAVLDDVGVTTTPEVIGEDSFNCRTSPTVPIDSTSYPNLKVMIVHTVFGSTKLALEGTNALKPQGKTVESTATTNTGVTKKVKLFQSYPQIPANFFVTTF